jgi:hypothetical protein
MSRDWSRSRPTWTPSVASYDAVFWRRVSGRAPVVPLLGTLHRIVENQEQKVTVPLVDGLDEHDLLERLIEDSKPPLAAELRRLDYLLRAPWRYPPLPWGSRFGSRWEPGIFYGALSEAALLAEAAFYRLVFLSGMEVPFPDPVISQHTRFEARYQTEAGRRLDQPPFSRHEDVLRHPAEYGPCQSLGSVLREAGTVAFTYVSARATGRALNVGLFRPAGLRSRRHLRPVAGLCETRHDGVRFSFRGRLSWFPREQFLVDGDLPRPA